MNTSETIFLIGFMGSGKSTVGKVLAQKLQWNFLDTDDWIEENMGMSITSIFEIYGEPFFRNKETEALDYALQLDKTVVATGGGLACKDEHIQRITAESTSFYLKLSPNKVLERLRGETTKRPLLQRPEEELLMWVQGKIEARSHFYEQATYTLDVDQDVVDIVQDIQIYLAE